MVDGGGREKRAKGGRRRGQLYSARPTRGVPTGAEGFQGGEGWTARERRAIYGVVGGGGGWLRDWSKRLVAGADKKLHPKKVSPSPPRPPPRASPTPTRFFSFFFFPRSDVVTLSFHLVPLSETSPPASLAEQFHGSTGQPNLGYTLFLPANPFGRRNTENCSETNSSSAHTTPSYWSFHS